MTDKEKELQAEAIGYYRKRIAELEKENKALGERCLQLQKDKGNLIDKVRELEMTVGTLRNFSNEQATCIEKLEAQIEKMKSDVMANIKWADKNCDNMWQKLVKMWNQWEIKEK
jgi:predicted nuclease with TOPRIM domain